MASSTCSPLLEETHKQSSSSPSFHHRLLLPSQIEQFHTDGFVHIPSLLPEEDMKHIEEAFTRVYAKVEAVASDPSRREDIVRQLEAATGANAITKHIILLGHDGSRFTFQLKGDVDIATATKQGILDGTILPSLHVLSLRHVAWVGKEEKVLEDYGRHPSLLQLATSLLDIHALQRDGHGSIDMIINQSHFKEPNDGVAFPWHQDSMHRRMAFGDFIDVNGHGSYVQIILAVDDTTADAGPVMFIPNSGQVGHLNGQAGLDPSKVEASHTAVAPLLKRGDCVCLNPFTIHGSKPNTSAHWRRTFINGFAYPGAQVERVKVHCETIDVKAHIVALVGGSSA